MSDLYIRQPTNDTISEATNAKAVFNSSHPPDEVRYEEYHYDHKAAYYFLSSHSPLVFLAVQSRACFVVLELQIYVRHKVDAEVVAELFEALYRVKNSLQCGTE